MYNVLFILGYGDAVSLFRYPGVILISKPPVVTEHHIIFHVKYSAEYYDV